MRTEKEILKDFEKYGYTKQFWKDYILILEGTEVSLEIDTKHKWFRSCVWNSILSNRKHSWYLSMNDHKLLHELFECWGWIND